MVATAGGVGTHGVVDLAGLDRLIASLQSQGYEVIGPQNRDGAVVYDTLEKVAGRPRACTGKRGSRGMIYVYAVTDRPEAPLPDRWGLRNEELAKVVWQDVVAVVSTLDGAQLSRKADELWRHEEVVESLMSDRAVLPVRFGTRLPSRERVSDMLCRAYRALVQDIERVRGHVEVGMRFLTAIENGAQADPPLTSSNGLPGARSGAAYLRARLVEERELRNRQKTKLRLVREVYDLLASHANASQLDDRPDDQHGAAAAFLVPCERIGIFCEIVSEAANAHPELALLCTGPWPAYSFVNAGERAGTWSNECHAS